MKKMLQILFLVVLVSVGIAIVFEPAAVAGDLTRKEAERLYFSAFPNAKSSLPIYLYLITGKWGTSFMFSMGGEKEVYLELHKLGLVSFKEEEKGMTTEFTCQITEKGKAIVIEVPKGEKEGLEKQGIKDSEIYKWYRIKMFNLKVTGCTGVKNIKELNGALANFEVKCSEATETFYAIKEKLGTTFDLGWKDMDKRFMWSFLRRDWLRNIIQDPKAVITHQVTYELYDDGWRLSKPQK